MSINIGPPAIEELRPRISVIGVGGAGGNAIANMIGAKIEGVDFVVANTDAQALNTSIAEYRIQLGPEITQGLGAGSRPDVGRAAAEETMAEIERALDGAHMCFIAAGMGGGTGTGAAPVIAKAAREKGVLTVGVVTKPFLFEGSRRMRAAEAGIEELQKYVDTLIVIPNQNLFLVASADTTFKDAFLLADEVLQQGVRSITDLMVMPGLINLDFADVRSVMAEMGKAMMGTGEGSGENRALEAATKAIANPLLEGVSMKGARGVIISIIGGEDMRLLEVDEAANHIRELVDPQANIIWGSAFNPDLEGRIRVSVVATGIEETTVRAEDVPQAFRSSGAMSSVAGGAQGGVAHAGAGSTPRAFSMPFGALRPFDHNSTMPNPAMPNPAMPNPAMPNPAMDETSAAGHRKSIQATVSETALPFVAEERSLLELDLAQQTFDPMAHVGAPRVDEMLLDEDHLAPNGLSVGKVNDLSASGVLAEGHDTRHLISPGAASEVTMPPHGDRADLTGGGTLFERMANLTGRRRGVEPMEGHDDDAGAINVPRFLGRQNN